MHTSRSERRWFDGDSNPVNSTKDVGKDNAFFESLDSRPDPRVLDYSRRRACIAVEVEQGVTDPLEILIQSEEAGQE